MSDSETYNWCGLFCGGSKKVQDDITIKQTWSCWIFGCKSMEIHETDSKIKYIKENLCNLCIEKQTEKKDSIKETSYNGPCCNYNKKEEITDFTLENKCDNKGETKDEICCTYSDTNKKMIYSKISQDEDNTGKSKDNELSIIKKSM